MKQATKEHVFTGYFKADYPTSMESWMQGICDDIIKYNEEIRRAIHVDWPTYVL